MNWGRRVEAARKDVERGSTAFRWGAVCRVELTRWLPGSSHFFQPMMALVLGLHVKFTRFRAFNTSLRLGSAVSYSFLPLVALCSNLLCFFSQPKDVCFSMSTTVSVLQAIPGQSPPTPSTKALIPVRIHTRRQGGRAV